MSFTHRNDGFSCEHCGALVSAAHGTCRNHCTACLASKHVDVQPGDRASRCGGLMLPREVLWGGKKSDFTIVHECQLCGHQQRNRSAGDDDNAVLVGFVGVGAKVF